MEPVEDSPECVVVAYANGRLPMLGFQQVPNYVAPRWQDPRHPSQIHLDFHFEDHDDAMARAERLGAVRLPGGGSCPVYADPESHPFCCARPEHDNAPSTGDRNTWHRRQSARLLQWSGPGSGRKL